MRESAYPSGVRSAGWPNVVETSFGITDDGLVCDGDLILVGMTKQAGANGHLAIGQDYDRAVALLSVAGGRPVAHDDVFPAIEAAADHWRRGDKALANLRLIFSGLPRLATPEDVGRIRLADTVLGHGVTPNALMKALWPASPPVSKYARTQNRVPAGNGEDSGRFTFGSWDLSLASTGQGHATAIVVAASEKPPPSRDKTFEERELLGVATPQEELAHGRPIDPLAGLPRGIGLGPYAGKPIPAGPGPRPSTLQRLHVNEEGNKNGCHNCGTKDSGRPRGDWIADHQAPTALNPPGQQQVYFPHCISCSRSQGGRVSSFKAKGQNK